MKKLFLSFATGLLSFAATAAPVQPIEQTITNQTDGYILRITGSSTLGKELLPNLVEQYLQAKQVQNIDRIAMGREQSSLIRGTTPSGASVNVLVEAKGTSTGFSALINDTTDIAAASRRVTDDENARYATSDLTTSQFEHIIGLDGLAMVINQNNPVSQLSIDEIGKIYAGEISNWSQLSDKYPELNGFSGRITVLARDDASGTFETFDNLVLERGYRLADSVQRFNSNGQITQAVETDTMAIGFTSVADTGNTRPLPVTDGATTPLTAEKMFIASEDYPLTRRLYLYTGTSANVHVREFIEFVASTQGQSTVDRVGFISQNIEKLPQAITADMPTGYLQLVGRAERLSLNFRFTGDSRQLDSKAERDMSRLVAFMQRPENQNRELMLFGFAADQGDEERARLLSEVRMLAIRKELRKYGIRADAVKGYGSLNPVASNDNPISADRNNRVEVWIKE
ncbi:substrate-binding domain-containing protein [Salinibius halmophilus]|uniref:substrate-binding domain-containing protein n=1 Tax=Salinibius halmophilus TaxID=1853216 RepID=UPI000E67112C|nr:phosphate ABC transporter substrate-binding/OmpA family protein [Salinibius halmophilus]